MDATSFYTDYLQTDEQKAQQHNHAQARALYLSDVRDVLATPQGRRVLLSILTDLGLCTTILQQSAKIYAAAALHDAATLIMSDIAAADPEHFNALMRHLLLQRNSQGAA